MGKPNTTLENVNMSYTNNELTYGPSEMSEEICDKSSSTFFRYFLSHLALIAFQGHDVIQNIEGLYIQKQ